MLLKATMAKDQNTETSKLTKHDFSGSLPANVILNSQLRLTQKILLPQAMKNQIAVEVFYFKARFLSILVQFVVKARGNFTEKYDRVCILCNNKIEYWCACLRPKRFGYLYQKVRVKNQDFLFQNNPKQKNNPLPEKSESML